MTSFIKPEQTFKSDQIRLVRKTSVDKVTVHIFQRHLSKTGRHWHSNGSI